MFPAKIGEVVQLVTNKMTGFCPCGSGFLYNDCCGKSTNVVSLAQVRWRKTGQLLRRKLGEYIDSAELSKDAYRAQEIYFRYIDFEINDFDNDFLMERCFEWFIFDYRLPEGDRVIERFQTMSFLNKEEKNLLNNWSNAINGLYEVKTVFPGKGLILEDILSKNQLMVMDSNAVKETDCGSILYMRVLPVGNENEFSTSGLALTSSCRDKLIKRLSHDANRYWERVNSCRDWNIYLRERSHIVNSIVMKMTVYPGFDWLEQEESDYDSSCLNCNETEALHSLMLLSDVFPWREICYRNVARAAAKELYCLNYNHRQVSNAMRMWYDYTCSQSPNFRKPEVWVATIIYAVCKLEQDNRQNRNTLAEKFSISPSTISGKYRSLSDVLGLEKGYKQYSSSSNIAFLSQLFLKRK